MAIRPTLVSNGPWSKTTASGACRCRRLFAGLALLLGSAAAGAVTTTLSVPATDYDGTFVVSWNAAGPNGGGYTQLRQRHNGGSWVILTQKGLGNQSHTVTVGAGGTYDFIVHYAYIPPNPCGGPGCNPNLVHDDTTIETTVVTLTPPASAPTLSLPATDNNGSYTVNWNAVPAAANYQWQERVNGGGWSGATSTSNTSVSRSGKSSATYGYRVRACNGNGCSGYSAQKSIIVAVTPGVPASLSGSPNPSSGNVTVSWGSASGSVTKYDFDYKKSTTGSWSNGYDGTALSKALTSLAAGTWNYRVRACKTQSTYTSCSGWRTGSSTIALPPAGAPTLSLPATNNSGSYTVSWNAVSGAANYQWQERVNGGSWSSATTTSNTSFSRSKSSGIYGYRVKACNAVGCSGYSAEKSIIVAKKPGTPSSISASPNPSTGNVTVSWGSASGSVTKYDFDYKKSTVGSWSNGYDGPNLSKALSGLAEGTWNYRVRACKTVSSYTSCSGWRTGSSTILPAAPTGLMGPSTDYNGAYTISWNSSSGATSYRLEERIGAGSWSQIYSGAATSRAISGNPAGSYSYRVRACNVESACGSWSASHTVTVTPPPAIPTGLTATQPQSGSYMVSWNSSSGSSSYRLEEQKGAGPWGQVYSGSSISKATSGQEGGFAYSYRVKGCNVESVCSGWSGTHTVVVMGDTTTYEYDELGRLIRVTHPNAVTTEYNYDPAGNRTSTESSLNN